MAAEKNRPASGGKDDLDQLNKALWQARINNIILGTLLVATLVALVYFGFFWRPAQAIDSRALTDAAADSLAEHAPTILAEATDLAAETGPPVADALARQFRADLPVYLRALEEQGEEMAENLKIAAKKRLKAQLKDYLKKHRNVLREELPDIASEEAVARLEADFEQAAERLIERYYLDDFARQTKRTVKLWRQFEPVPRPKGDVSLEDQFWEYFGDWATLRLKERGEKAAAKAIGG